MIPMLLVSLVSCCVIMALVWLWAYRIQNAGVVDIFWSFNFALVAIIIFLMGDGYEARKNVISLLVACWSLRLGIYLLFRVGGHMQEEEGRYKQLRKEWAPHPNRKFFFFFQAQALSNIFLSLPFFIVAVNKNPALSLLEEIGAGLFFVSILGEAASDWQLRQFKKDPSNKGKVCQNGLWNYSRHPNYFFQLMIWISVFIFSLSSPYGWISIVCPLTIGFLIFKVTGIPMTEEQSLRSRGKLYEEYQRTTSVFVPWFKKS
ncbi:MAG: DUF1295 domain-containing protein [Bacteroidia bacterium]